MKKIMTVLALCFLGTSALACDEACKKEQAEINTGQKIPGYLSWSYCDEIKYEFLNSSMRSLQKFSDGLAEQDSKNKRRRASMRNTEKYLEARKEWLGECDNYLQITGKGRIFQDDETTDKIFAAIDAVTDELTNQIKGATYTDALSGIDTSAEVANEKFDQLFTSVRLHIDKANLRGSGLYVTR